MYTATFSVAGSSVGPPAEVLRSGKAPAVIPEGEGTARCPHTSC